MSSSGIITLITDFGVQDPYVGQLKGALLKNYREVTIVDLTHSIAPQNIPAAGEALFSSFQYFPAGTVHLAVVDPGVGSARKILAAAGAGSYFIAPDNGIFTLLFDHGIIDEVYQVTFEPMKKSTTFHGRDVMAPVAAQLAKGVPLSGIGNPVVQDRCVLLSQPGFVQKEDHLVAEVTRVDHFGNLRISIKETDLKRIGVNPSKMRITIGKAEVSSLSATYSSQDAGCLCALIDSDGFLEVAVNQGNAADEIPAQLGDRVLIWFKA